MTRKLEYSDLFADVNQFSRRTIHSFYPDYIYKFISFDDSTLDDIKIQTLLSNELFFSRMENLNDPFEFISMTACEDSLKIHKLDWVETFNRIFNEWKNKRVVCCFTTSMSDNIAMWANYANNNKGFCCRYRIKQKTADYLIDFSRVSYVEKPRFIDKKHLNWLLIQDFDEFKNKNLLKKLQIFNYMYRNMLCSYKAKCWNTENEIRIHKFINDDMAKNKESKGITINLENLNLELTDIYAGTACKREEDLRNVANSLKVNFHKMKVSSSKYILEEE